MTSRRWSREALLCASLYAVAALVLGWASSRLGVGEGEVSYIEASIGVRRALTAGPSALAQLGRSLHLLPGVAAAYAHDLGALVGVDRLVSLRAPQVLLSATAAPLVYVLCRRMHGPLLASCAAIFCVLSPRWLVEGATLGGEGAASALLVAVAAAYVRSVERGGGWALAGAIAFGVALSLTSGALFLLPALLLTHLSLSRGRAERLERAGMAPVPLALALCLLVGPLVLVSHTPWFWASTGERLRDLAVELASPRVGAGLWAGEAPEPPELPRMHTAAMLFVSMPSMPLVLGLVGVALAVHARLHERDRAASIALWALASLCGLPLLLPPGLGAFPGHFALAVPFFAVLAAHGVAMVLPLASRALSSFSSERAASLSTLLVLVLTPTLSTLRSGATLGAALPSLSRLFLSGAPSGPLPTHDGTAVLPLCEAIDALGRASVRLHPGPLSLRRLELLHALGRLKTRPLPAGDAGPELVIVSGAPRAEGAKVIASVGRDGVTLLSLVAP